MPKDRWQESYLEKVQIPGVDSAFIMRNSVLEELLFNRNLVGLDFTRACEATSVFFLRHFEDELRSVMDDVAELMLLSKGLYYWLHNAFAKVFEENLQTNFIATQRINVEGDSADVIIPYSNLDAPAGNLIIGDTIASGATIVTALSLYQKHYDLRRVFVFSIVGSTVGGQAISSYCRERGIELTIIYGLAAFGLGENGFDLSFLHPETITRAEYRERAIKVFGGQPVSAAGWDFGSQAQSIRKYRMLCWLEENKYQLEQNSVFRLKECPSDRRLVRKERFAYQEVDTPTELQLDDELAVGR